jgi:hypothetical protein
MSYVKPPARGRALKYNKMKTLKLQVGKTYRSREGEEVKIVRKNNKNVFPYQGSNGRWYAENGKWGYFPNEHPEDLIVEGPDPILQFFTPSRMELLSISAIETAAGIPPRTLYKFLKGTRGLPKKHREPLIEILKKVGYDG